MQYCIGFLWFPPRWTYGYECTLCIAFQTFLMPIPQDDFRDELGCVKSIAVRRGRGCIAQSSELTVTASASTAEYVRRFGLFMCLLIPIPIPILRFSRVPDLLQIGFESRRAANQRVSLLFFTWALLCNIYIYIHIYTWCKSCVFFLMCIPSSHSSFSEIRAFRNCVKTVCFLIMEIAYNNTDNSIERSGFHTILIDIRRRVLSIVLYSVKPENRHQEYLIPPYMIWMRKLIFKSSSNINYTIAVIYLHKWCVTKQNSKLWFHITTHITRNIYSHFHIHIDWSS